MTHRTVGWVTLTAAGLPHLQAATDVGLLLWVALLPVWAATLGWRLVRDGPVASAEPGLP